MTEREAYNRGRVVARILAVLRKHGMTGPHVAADMGNAGALFWEAVAEQAGLKRPPSRATVAQVLAHLEVEHEPKVPAHQ